MSFPAPLSRFVLRPRTAFPPNEALPTGWQDWEGGPFPHGAYVIWTGAHELRKLQVVFSRLAPTGVATDPAVCSMHFLNLTGGAPDATWVDGDFTAVEGALDSAWTVIKDYYTTGMTLDQYRWYKDGPAFHPTPVDGNAAVRIIERNVAGTNTTAMALPPQVALSVTEKTAIRKRWGRIYLPAPAASNSTTAGVAGSTMIVAVANAFDTFYETCRAADIIPVVFSPTLEASYEILSVQVDNLFDVIRSRRWKAASQKESRTLT